MAAGNAVGAVLVDSVVPGTTVELSPDVANGCGVTAGGSLAETMRVVLFWGTDRTDHVSQTGPRDASDVTSELVLFGNTVGTSGTELVLVGAGNKLVDVSVPLVLLTTEESPEAVLLRNVKALDVAASTVELRCDMVVECVRRLALVSKAGKFGRVSEKLSVPTVLVMVRVIITTVSLPVTRGPALEPEPREVSTVALLAVAVSMGVGLGVADNAIVVLPALGTDVEMEATVSLLAVMLSMLVGEEVTDVMFPMLGIDGEGEKAWVLEEIAAVEFTHTGDGLTGRGVKNVACWLVEGTWIVEFNHTVDWLTGTAVEGTTGVANGSGAVVSGIENGRGVDVWSTCETRLAVVETTAGSAVEKMPG
jgi:hypothetical protein